MSKSGMVTESGWTMTTDQDAIWAGDAIPDVRRPCDRGGCKGTYAAKGSPHFDNDGRAMIDLACDRKCGMESVAYWGWQGGDSGEDGDVDVWADVDADLRRRGSIW